MLHIKSNRRCGRFVTSFRKFLFLSPSSDKHTKKKLNKRMKNSVKQQPVSEVVTVLQVPRGGLPGGLWEGETPGTAARPQTWSLSWGQTVHWGELTWLWAEGQQVGSLCESYPLHQTVPNMWWCSFSFGPSIWISWISTAHYDLLLSLTMKLNTRLVRQGLAAC